MYLYDVQISCRFSVSYACFNGIINVRVEVFPHRTNLVLTWLCTFAFANIKFKNIYPIFSEECLLL